MASMIHTETFDVVEERVRQTVEDSQDVVETLKDVAIGRTSASSLRWVEQQRLGV
ncbi:unnamed protein product [Symbiodinium sp. CCMP2456]|nr:unnamed protein product [Symbiodinium sp. CCMP2456]